MRSMLLRRYYFKHGISKIYTYNQSRFKTYLTKKLFYKEFGDPLKVVQEVQEEIDYKLKPSEVLVKMLAAPVNPADINMIQGKYGIKPKLPSIPGTEGVGEILETGNKVKNFLVGDRIISATSRTGTWQTHVAISCDDIFKVPKELDIIEAACLKVNPCTAYCMLKYSKSIETGDTVIQNGANSSVGQNVIQIARNLGLKTVNVVRNRPNINEMKTFLTSLGATYVFTEEEIIKTNIFKEKTLMKPKLFLNCIGGINALNIMRHLDENAMLVTYGGMSMQPLTIPTGVLIFKNLNVCGFWNTRWMEQNTSTGKRTEVLQELVSMMMKGKLIGSISEKISFKNYKTALSNTMNVEGKVGKKYIFMIQ